MVQHMKICMNKWRKTRHDGLNVEKVCDKIQHYFMIKILSNLWTERHYLNIRAWVSRWCFTVMNNCVYADMTTYFLFAVGLPCLNIEYITILGQFSLAFLSTKHFQVYDIYQIFKFWGAFKKYSYLYVCRP